MFAKRWEQNKEIKKIFYQRQKKLSKALLIQLKEDRKNE